MNVSPLSQPVPLANTTNTGGTASTGTGGTSSSNPLQDTNNMFMQLLTAQLQNQDPTDPVDPTQFTTQLVEFNMLDQLTQINQTLQNAFPASGTTSTSPATGSNQTIQGAN